MRGRGQDRTLIGHVTIWAALGLVLGLPAIEGGLAGAAPTPPKEFTILFDATGLEPPTFWQVPGVTPEMATLDPDSTDALRTEVKQQLTMKPGTYWYGTFTFSFQFTVTRDGRVDYPKTLDQCVGGRGTQTLIVTCRRTFPYGGQRDY